MTSRLTLSIDTKVIASAKRISKARGQSISKMVEDHLKGMGQSEKSLKTKGSILELRGIGGKVSKNFNYKKEVTEYLERKYK
ncbi:MAG: DUF6364 family protein [Flammeovirgaceae bacterium]